MAAAEHEWQYAERLSAIYAEQLQGMRDGLLAVNRNVLTYIADVRDVRDEGRERGKQIDALLTRLDQCARELAQLNSRWRWCILAGAALFLGLAVLTIGVGALLIRVF